jgi:hypothetical protein
MPKSSLTPEQVEHRLSLKRAEYRDPSYSKRCPTCKQHLYREHYYVCPSRYDGLSPQCKACQYRRLAAWNRARNELFRTLRANGFRVVPHGRV